MSCRSFVPRYIEDGKEKVTARFNLGVASVNLAYVALQSGGDKEKFFEKLGDACDLAFKANQFRIERLKGTKAKVSPILWQYGALATLNPEDTIDHLFYGGNATCSIGYGALAETLDILGDGSKQFAMSVLQFMKDKTELYTKDTDIAYSLYGTPLESGAYGFAESVKKAFPDYDLGRDYVTNSFHIPPFTEIGVEGKLEWESDFYKISSGGNVNNVELPNLQHNLAAMGGVVQMAYDKVNYLILNQPIDKCHLCGYSGDFVSEDDGFHCPSCGNNNPETANCIRRISGFIHDALARPANFGKYAEQRNRVKNM